MGRVLLVDDDRDVLETLAARFAVAGHDVIACASYIEATDRLQPGFEGCVVTDIRMPGKTGLDLIELAHKIDPELPILVLTGFAETQTVVQAIRSGALTVLEKPCSMDTLLQAIQSAITQRDSILKTRKTRAKRAARSATGRAPKERALSPMMQEYEAELIQRALKRNGGNKAKAAKELGISKTQLYAKIKS